MLFARNEVIMHVFFRFAACFVCAAALSACAGAQRQMPSFPHRPAQTDWDEEALAAAVESFYTAEDMDAAAAAVERAAEIAPEAPATHEIAGRLERYRGNEHEAWRHFYLALADPENPAAFFHVLDLLELQETTSEYREAMALFEELLEGHPDHHLRRVSAAFLASWRRRLDANVEGARAALEHRGSITEFALISPFDNEEGKGFSVEYPPEREVDLEAEYPGIPFPARWRVDVPLDHQNNLDLLALISPGNSVVAYAASWVRVPDDGRYHVRVTTTDPVRLWVNSIEMLSIERVANETVDQFVVPVTLRAGWNRLLLKSCQDSGAWRVGVAVTDDLDRLVEGIESSAEPREVEPGAAPGPPYSFGERAVQRLERIPGSMRKAHLAIDLAHALGLSAETQNLADAYVSLVPEGLLSRYVSALVHWRSGQAGHTIDTIGKLIEENGPKAPRALLFRSRFFSDQDRSDRAREDLLAALEANPDYRSARYALSRNYASEGWNEDALKARLRDVEQWPDDTAMLWALSRSYRALGRDDEAEEIYDRILELWSGAEDILGQQVSAALDKNRYGRALDYQEEACRIYPSSPTCFLDLGKIHRRAGKVKKAERAFRRALEIDDRWSTPYVRLGSMAYEQGDDERAVELWKRGLEFAPDNHSLADRIEFVAPSDSGMLDDYVPSEARIREVLAGRGEVEIQTGANLVYLLDHAVERIESDGSGRQVVTQVATVVNDTGRDQLTRHSFPRGRLKVFEAYAIDMDGTRREASSLRGRQVRFRELKVGSTVVLQYRLDTRPSGYLHRHVYRRWFFHGVGSQFEDSEFVLLLPEEMEINEWGQGDYERRETERRDRRVLRFSAERVPPLVGEPSSPPVINLLDQVIISSIPDWDTIAGWDAALMVDAFRSNPHIRELAEEITSDAETAGERLDAITRFVMREIRYQQDYENTIAGVKPHPASIVLQRGYGDCKDKSVLLMTLAEQVGIDTRFAVLRTTGSGDFIKEIPFLQFNHAIVYVPEQEGIAAPRFVDPTPDTLDLETLRPDAQGTWAMTIDPETRSWDFEKIPMQPASDQFTLRTARIEPAVEGESRIELDFAFQGPTAGSLRQVLRNPDDTQILAAQMVAQLFPGAQVETLVYRGADDIVEPLEIEMTAVSEQVVRRQGENLLIDLPRSESLSSYVSLSERELPLQSGLYLSLVESTDEVVIPEGWRVLHAPESVSMDNEFFQFERAAEKKDGRIDVELRFAEKTNRISPEEYPRFRELVGKVVDNIKQNLILAPE
jgi:cellulose synthase operon protein C